MNKGKEGLFDLNLVEEDAFLYISFAQYFFNPIHDRFLGDSFHIFSTLRQNSNEMGIPTIIQCIEFVSDQGFFYSSPDLQYFASNYDTIVK